MLKKITKNFYLYELTQIVPTNEQLFCLELLAIKLQKIRDHFNNPIKILSGLRNKAINDGLRDKGYNSSKTSDHMAWCADNPTGLGAVDFTMSDIEVVFKWIINNISEYEQLIFYPDNGFIHLSNRWDQVFKSPNPRNQNNRLLKVINGKLFKVLP